MSKLDNSNQKATIKYSPRGKIWYSEQTISPDERARGTLCNMEPGCFVNWTCSVLFCNIIIFISRLWTLVGQISFDCGDFVDATGDSVTFAIIAQMIFFRELTLRTTLLVFLHKTLDAIWSGVSDNPKCVGKLNTKSHI